MKSFDSDEIKKYFNSVLSKNNSRFFRKLSKYFDVCQVIKMPPLRTEKSMGKLYMNNFDFTADIRDYMNFCIGFLAK